MMRVLIVDRRRASRRRWKTLRESILASGDEATVERVGGGAAVAAVGVMGRLIRVGRRHDIVVGFLNSGPGLWTSYLAVRGFVRRPFVVFVGGDPFRSTVHELMPDTSGIAIRSLRGWWCRVNALMLAAVYRRVDGVIYVSNHLRRDVERRIGCRKTSVIVPPASSQVESIGGPRPRPLADGDDIRVLTVTNLTYRSKYEGVLRMVHGMAAATSNWKGTMTLQIAGGGAFEPVLRERIANMTRPHRLVVQVLGQVADVHALYRASDLFAYASDYDGFPNVLVEAMSHGLPMIVSDEPLFDEVVGVDDRAARFPAADASRFARELVALAKDHERRVAMSRANLAFVTSLLDRESVGRRVGAFFRRLLFEFGHGGDARGSA